MKEKVVIEFLYLDLSVCTRCQGTDESLDKAIEEVSEVLKATGRIVEVKKINVDSEVLAKKHKFITSPTIRVNGRDIQRDIHEGNCESCGYLCGDVVDCRVWVYDGQEYSEPPQALIIDSILKEVYGRHDEIESKDYEIPDNLKMFYENMRKHKGMKIL